MGGANYYNKKQGKGKGINNENSTSWKFMLICRQHFIFSGWWTIIYIDVDDNQM